ncbi:hypothetical protein [Kitasatospora purpeofusca]|uniref:hypothetical protein n=1 Tax=Kitasatospora purpeofusca TaxID=67352 RepID=UPI003657FEF9
MEPLWSGAAVLIAVLLAVGAISDWRAHRRVRSARAYDVTPEQIRYVSLRQEDGR